MFLYKSIYFCAIFMGEYFFVLINPLYINFSRNLAFVIIFINAVCISLTLYGFTKIAPSPQISFIGDMFDVMMTRPIDCPSMMGIPKPSLSEIKLTISHWRYSSIISLSGRPYLQENDMFFSFNRLYVLLFIFPIIRKWHFIFSK